MIFHFTLTHTILDDLLSLVSTVRERIKRVREVRKSTSYLVDTT